MRKPVFFTAALFLLTCCGVAQTANAPYRFASAFIEEMGAFEKIRADAERDMKSGRESSLEGCVRSSKALRVELQSAADTMRGMKLDGRFRDVPARLAELFRQKSGVYRQMGDECSAVLSGPNPGAAYERIATDAPKLTARLDDFDKAIYDSTPFVFASLTSDNPDRANRLAISKTQRDDLVGALDTAFGPKLNRTDQNYIVGAASALRAYLTKKGYKSSDEP
jgi:hypothetical protein